MTDERELPESGAPFAVRTTRRRGRMSAAKRDALIDLLPRWSLPNPLTTPLTESSLRATFGRSAPRLLDIGVGTGEATLAWAIDNPDHDVVAVELHRPGIARMLQVLESEGPPNVRIVETDAVRLLDALTNPASTTAGGVAPSPQATEPTAGTSTCPPPPPGASATHGDATATSHDPAVGTAGASHDLPRFDLPRFDGVRVLFPDPWPKARHRSRRLVDRRFVATVADLLPDGGWLHLATDWDGYALQMVRALLAEPRFEVDADPGALAEVVDPDHGLDERQVVDRGATFPTPADATEGRWDGDRISWSSARPPRPVTTYERRGMEAGRRVTDLLAHRRDRPDDLAATTVLPVRSGPRRRPSG